MVQSERSSTQRARLQNALERQVLRYQRHLERLHAINRRFSWYRLAAFLLGLAAIWLALVYLDAAGVWVTIVLALVLFSLVVYFHRRLDLRITRFKTSQQIKVDKLRRMKLEWDDIPYSWYRPSHERSPLEIDLDLTGRRSLHHLLDLAISKEGSAMLADWLHKPEHDLEQISDRQAVVRELASLPGFIDRLLLNLKLVSQEQLQGERLLAWLSVQVPSRRLNAVLGAGVVLSVLNAALFILNISGRLPPYWPFTLVLTFGLYLFNSGVVGELLNAVVALDGELDQFRALLRYLEKYPYQGHEHLQALTAPFADPRQLPTAQISRVRWVTAAIGLRSNPLLAFLLNVVFPWDFAFAWLAKRMQGDMRELMPSWLQVWYRLEGLCSLANFAYINPEYRFPELVEASAAATNGPIFMAREMGHPLIPAERKVCNDFSIPSQGEVVLITGSNMAGKSTFIKTIGVNLCLAYAGGPVDAALLRTLVFRMHTCIRINDSISDGFSYFYAEVKCLRALLEELRMDDTAPLLYLIDEIFRGTNNRERLIGSRAYVKALIGAHGAGMIATHDLELARLEQESQQVENYHFRDRVEDGRLVFDYRIQPGPCPTSNALKIMEMEGLPVGV